MELRWKLTAKAENIFAYSYRPKLNKSPNLDPELASYYQSQIEILMWMVKLGSIDINREVFTLASPLALPN